MSLGEIYLDVETLRAADEVPGGWNNIAGFGLSVAVTWDQETGYREWYEGDATALVAELGRHGRVVTFNGERFDFQVLAAYCPVDPLYTKSLDILQDLRRRLGFRVSLQSVAQATLGRAKGGTGLDAIRWWQSGDPALRQKVVEYCRLDVELLRECVSYGREKGFVFITDPNNQQRQIVYVAWPPENPPLPVSRLVNPG